MITTTMDFCTHRRSTALAGAYGFDASTDWMLSGRGLYVWDFNAPTRKLNAADVVCAEVKCAQFGGTA